MNIYKFLCVYSCKFMCLSSMISLFLFQITINVYIHGNIQILYLEHIINLYFYLKFKQSHYFHNVDQQVYSTQFHPLSIILTNTMMAQGIQTLFTLLLHNLGFVLLRTTSDDDQIILCGHNYFFVINFFFSKIKFCKFHYMSFCSINIFYILDL